MDAGKRAELSETVGAALQIVFRDCGAGFEARGRRDLIGSEFGRACDFDGGEFSGAGFGGRLRAREGREKHAGEQG